MKIKKIKFEYFYPLVSILCLLYINQYQTVFYYDGLSKMSYVYDKLYYYVAIPSFYFFLFSYISIAIYDCLNINISKILNKIIKYAVCLVFIFYIILIITNVIKIYIGFISIYSIFFSVLGCLFTLVTHKKEKEM